MNILQRACMAALSALLAVPAGAAVESLALRDAGALRWVCGGIGADERRSLASISAGTNLEVLFVSAKRGGYLAGAQLVVYGRGVPQPLLRVESTGPVCRIDAPAGEYRLVASLDGVTREKVVRLGRPGHQGARAVMTFPDEPWDGIRASEEEKRQARAP